MQRERDARARRSGRRAVDGDVFVKQWHLHRVYRSSDIRFSWKSSCDVVVIAHLRRLLVYQSSNVVHGEEHAGVGRRRAQDTRNETSVEGSNTAGGV